MPRAVKQIKSVDLYTEDENFDIDLNLLDSNEQTDDEPFISNYKVYSFDNTKRNSSYEQDLMVFDPRDPNVHQLNLLYEPLVVEARGKNGHNNLRDSASQKSRQL